MDPVEDADPITTELVVYLFPGQGDGGERLMNRLLDPRGRGNEDDFLHLSFLKEVCMISTIRNVDVESILRYKREGRRISVVQINGTKSFQDRVANFLGGVNHMDFRTWNFIITGGYVSVQSIPPINLPVGFRLIPPQHNRAPVEGPRDLVEVGGNQRADDERNADSPITVYSEASRFSSPFSPREEELIPPQRQNDRFSPVPPAPSPARRAALPPDWVHGPSEIENRFRESIRMAANVHPYLRPLPPPFPRYRH